MREKKKGKEETTIDPETTATATAAAALFVAIFGGATAGERAFASLELIFSVCLSANFCPNHCKALPQTKAK